MSTRASMAIASWEMWKPICRALHKKRNRRLEKETAPPGDCRSGLFAYGFDLERFI